MLYWNANFQIPNSGVQAAEVYVIASEEDGKVKAVHYSDNLLSNILFINEYNSTGDEQDLYSYLLTLDEFANYTRAE